jgi:hypothetical protein
MKKFIIAAVVLSGALSPAFAIDGKHVNGYVVTPHYWAGWATCCACNPPVRGGHIMLTTIQNGAPTKTDTIYNRTQGLALCPQFDIEGRRVAFYRSSIGTSANGLTCATVNNGGSYVSVINRDGTGLKNLVALRAQPTDEIMLAWPAGNWIYYINPKSSSGAGGIGTEIHKVNVSTQQDQFVWQDGNSGNWFRRFTLSADGSRIGCQNTPNGSNMVGTFPGMSTLCGMVACNGAVSPSGLLGGSYFGGAHAELFIHKVDGCSDFGWFSIRNETSATPNYRGSAQAWMAQSPFDGNEGCELIRWAVNSDKWVLQDVGWCGHASNIEQGSNSLVANFIDKVAFLVPVPNNPRVACLPNSADIIRHNDFTGSMWVDGGNDNRGKWEDTTGVWHAIPGYTPTTVRPAPTAMPFRTTNATRAGQQIVFSGDGAYRFRITDLRGKCVLSSTSAGPAMVETKALPAGTWLADIVRAGIREHSAIVVSR